jgi:DNA-binding transcriptional ArsR family regulator
LASDKNKSLLEKQLKAVGKRIRVDILKILSNSQIPLTYSVLQKEVLGKNSTSSNFSFHLKTLKENNLVEMLEDGYSLTVLGRQILRNILSIEQILNVQNKSIMIRTSKYSKEPFDLGKIEDYLINEGKMVLYQARQIAQEVEERLSKTKIDYLTAPLMRDYINGILLENGLEKVRHRLTRLGTPPSDVSHCFDDSDLNPKSFIKVLGSEISEQYLLLNLLPNKLADLFLSGNVHLLHLNYWGLRPLSIYINTSDVMEFIKKRIDFTNNLPSTLSSMKLIMELLKVLRTLKPYFSEDLLLGSFNQFLEKINNNPDIRKPCYLTLISEILDFNSTYLDKRPHLTLDLNSINISFLDLSSELSEEIPYGVFPNLMIAYSDSKNESLDMIRALLNSRLGKNMSLYNETHSKLMNSTLNYVNTKFHDEPTTNKIILDKLLINLHRIALEAHQNDDQFFEFVQERVKDVFQLYSLKKELVEKKLNASKAWNRLINSFFKDGESDWIHNSLKAISFYGLNEAIKFHCGIEIDRIEKSERFAIDVISLIRELINERNSEENEFYCINQPHEGEYLYQSKLNSHLQNQDKKYLAYSMSLIRKESKLPLDKKLKLYKEFEPLLNGGSIFNYFINSPYKNTEKDIEKLINSKISAFSIKFD